MNDISSEFQKFSKDSALNMQNYVGLLYNILQFLDSVDNPQVNSFFYADLFKAHITDEELCLVLYYMLGNRREMFLPTLMEKYRMFSNIKKLGLISSDVYSLYESTVKPS